METGDSKGLTGAASEACFSGDHALAGALSVADSALVTPESVMCARGAGVCVKGELAGAPAVAAAADEGGGAVRVATAGVALGVGRGADAVSEPLDSRLIWGLGRPAAGRGLRANCGDALAELGAEPTSGWVVAFAGLAPACAGVTALSADNSTELRAS